MTLPLYELQEAVLAALKSNSTVSSLTNNVYLRVPDKASAPYIRIGESRCTDRSNIDKLQFECELTLYAVNRSRNTDESTQILDAVHSALERVALNVSGYTLLGCRLMNASAPRAGNRQDAPASIMFKAMLAAN